MFLFLQLSIQELHNTRFYLQPKADEVTKLSVFIGNLPNDITKDEYREKLEEVLGKCKITFLLFISFRKLSQYY